MKYYRCIKCDLNFVEKEGDICDICKRTDLKSEDDVTVNVCLNCGKIIYGENEKYCKKCRENLNLDDYNFEYYNFDM